MKANTIRSASIWLGYRFLVVLACGLLSGCGEGRQQEVAVRELFDKEYAFTVDDFLRAAGEGNVAMVRRFLDAGMEADVADHNGERALLRSASSTARGTGDVATLLIAHGAVIGEGGGMTRPPLILAAGAPNAEVVAALLTAGANPVQRDALGWSALTYAASKGDARCIELLAPVSRTLLDDALLVASLEGRTELVDVLLANGASAQARSEDGTTALMYAAGRGHLETVELLLHREGNRFALAGDGQTAAERALDAGFLEIADRLSLPPTPEEISGEPADPLALRDALGQLLGRPAVDGVEHPARLMGAALRTSVESPVELGKRTRIREYRERQLPVVLKDVDAGGESADVRLLYGNHGIIRVPIGAEVTDSGLRVIDAKRRFKEAKDRDGELVNASSAVLEDMRTGQQYEVATNETARSARTGAVMDFSGSGEDWFEARRDDEFTVMVGQGDGEEQAFRILDVRPDQVVIECLETGEVLTVPRER